MERGSGLQPKTDLKALKIENEDPELETVVTDLRSYDLTADGKKIMLRKGTSYYMIEAGSSEVKDLSDSQISLKDWKFPITPRAEWRQLYTDAWRMERDYFYDKNMHGVDWDAMYTKYLPLVDRVTTREELSDLIGRFVGELSALHTSVRGGIPGRTRRIFPWPAWGRFSAGTKKAGVLRSKRFTGQIRTIRMKNPPWMIPISIFQKGISSPMSMEKR